MVLHKRNLKIPSLLSKSDKASVLMKNKLTSGPRNKEKHSFRPDKVNKLGKTAEFFHYSKQDDKLFCLACSFFGVSKPQSKEKSFSENGFSNWKRLNTTDKGANGHVKSATHLEATVKCSAFKETSKKGVSSLEFILDKEQAKNIRLNQKNLEATIEAVRLCGRQLLPLRGHCEAEVEGEPDENHGNFLGMLGHGKK